MKQDTIKKFVEYAMNQEAKSYKVLQFNNKYGK